MGGGTQACPSRPRTRAGLEVRPLEFAKAGPLKPVEPSDASGIVERLRDPVLVIAGDDPATRSIRFANEAARGLFRIVSQRTPLTTVLRHPAVLDAVEQALGGTVAETVYETGGVQTRSWRAMAEPMAGAEPRALLILRDETDARRTERMRADFLANASHELRTPLASLVGFVETLRGHAKDDPEARERFLAIMAGQAGRMARLIDDLLSLSRIEMNEHIAPDGRVDVSAAVQDMLGAAAPQMAARSVTAEPRLTAGAVALGDRDQIMQVLQNLFDNALKYSPSGERVIVEVALAASEQEASKSTLQGAARLPLLEPDRSEAGFVVVRFADQGPGIARANLPRLSERFYRVEGQKSGEREGTGLGLAIVKHILNRHRGGLLVESLEGQGTTFTAYFPALS